MKVLKASGRAPELEAWKQLFSTLEDRIRTHQQVNPYSLFCNVAEFLPLPINALVLIAIV
jgi:hypothetical protein